MSTSAPLDLGSAEDLLPGRYRIFKVDHREIGVIRLEDGSVHAVLNHCPHRGAPICRGPVSGTLLPSDRDDLTVGLRGEVVRCPWHGYEFSVRTGECLFTGSSSPLRTFPAEIRDGRIHIRGFPRRDRRSAEESSK